MKRILSWDWRSAPPASQIAEAINDFAGGDEYVVVLSSFPLDPADAHEAWTET